MPPLHEQLMGSCIMQHARARKGHHTCLCHVAVEAEGGAERHGLVSREPHHRFVEGGRVAPTRLFGTSKRECRRVLRQRWEGLAASATYVDKLSRI